LILDSALALGLFGGLYGSAIAVGDKLLYYIAYQEECLHA
jgi:hypothetical protein